MWVKNTETGNIWDVSDEFGEQLVKKGEFEEVEAPKKQPKRQAKPDVDEESK